MPNRNEQPTLTVTPQVLMVQQSRDIAVTVTNLTTTTITDIVVTSRGGLDISVVPRSIHRDQLEAQGAWKFILSMEALKHGEGVDLPIKLRWRTASGRTERSLSILHFQVTDADLKPSGTFHALIAGVDHYTDPRIPSVSNAIRDARLLSTTLVNKTGCGYTPDNVATALGPQATVSQLQMQIAELARKTARDDTALIYLSLRPCRVRIRGQWRSYLCLHDSIADELVAKGISTDAFSRLLSQIPSNRVLLILDTTRVSTPTRIKTLAGHRDWEPQWTESDFRQLCAATGYPLMIVQRHAAQTENDIDYSTRSFVACFLRALEGNPPRLPHRAVALRDIMVYLSENSQACGAECSVSLEMPAAEVDFPVAIAPPHQ